MNSMKTHRNLMDAAGIKAVDARVREVAATVISTHAADRMTQKNVTAKEVEHCLRYGSAVEVHNEAREWRAVVRLNPVAFGPTKDAVCVVIGIKTGTIVTAWKNAALDNHATLNLNAYKKLDVVRIFGRS